MANTQEVVKPAQLVQSVIPEPLYRKLKALAAKEDRSISYMVGKCIRDYLEGK